MFSYEPKSIIDAAHWVESNCEKCKKQNECEMVTKYSIHRIFNGPFEDDDMKAIMFSHPNCTELEAKDE